MTNPVYPSALDVRRDALDRASRFLDQSSYVANIRGPAVPPTVADLWSAADAILAWLLQPLPGDPNAEPEPAAQQFTNPQAEPRFRDLTIVTRHTGPGGVWHAGPYQTCVICQVGHNAVHPVSECSPLAQKQHALAVAQSNAVIPGVGPSAEPQGGSGSLALPDPPDVLVAFGRAMERMNDEAQTPAGNAPKSADANTKSTQSGIAGSTTPAPLSLVRDHEETGLSSSYKRPY